MAGYAAGTTVSVDRSVAEIKKLLTRYTAKGFAYAEEPHQHIIYFEAHDRRVKFTISLPKLETYQKLDRYPYRERPIKQQLALRDAEIRRLWRVLVLRIKAKLEAVDNGALFEEEFFSHVVMPNNRTAYEWAKPMVDQAYTSGTMPQLPQFTGDRP